MPMHPRACVSAISTFGLTLAEDVEFWRRHGIDRAGVSVAKLEAYGWDAGIDVVREAVAGGLDVANLIGVGPFDLTRPAQWDQQRGRLRRTLDAAVALDAGCVV